MCHKNSRFAPSLMLTAMVLLLPRSVEADMGIPLVVARPFILLTLLPVIIIEIAVFNWKLRAGWGSLGWRVGIANGVSAISGMLVMNGLDRLGVGAEVFLMFPPLGLAGLLLTFLGSVVLEGIIYRWFLRSFESSKTWGLTWKANGISYTFLLVAFIVCMVWRMAPR